jgi:hypothetical protein
VTYKPFIPTRDPIEVRHVYGIDDPFIPEGYESTGEFRLVQKGDLYLPHVSTYYIEGPIPDWISNIPSIYPRIIVRKIKRIVFTYLRTGSAVKDEWYTPVGNNDGSVYKWLVNEASIRHDLRIYSRTEED